MKLNWNLILKVVLAMIPITRQIFAYFKSNPEVDALKFGDQFRLALSPNEEGVIDNETMDHRMDTIGRILLLRKKGKATHSTTGR